MIAGFAKPMVFALMLIVEISSGFAADTISAPTVTLDRGFSLLYDLDFPGAHQVFNSWHRQHPDDPLGPASEAAGLLFSEFNRLGVLESQFYENDKEFAARKKLDPDPAIRDRFFAATDQAEKLARARLTQNARDRDALLAMTFASGLQADYAALIDKRNLNSLGFTREANSWAEELLAVDPDCYDAYLSTGFSKYIVGSMSAPVRWLVRVGGIPGDKKAGISELKLTAERGHYLAPFARILLAIAYVRAKDKVHAKELLVSLREQFPQNPLFTREIGRLDNLP